MPERDRGVEYRQIITQAVCGKGRRFSQATHTIHPPENIHHILGAWIINHRYESAKLGEIVEVRGSYDVNIWYSTKGNTKTDVVKETVHYVEQVPLSFFDRQSREGSLQVSATATQSPNCVEASLATQSDLVVVRVEKEFMVEMVGETKICIPVYPLEYAEVECKEILSFTHDQDAEYEDLDPDLIIDDLDD